MVYQQYTHNSKLKYIYRKFCKFKYYFVIFTLRSNLAATILFNLGESSQQEKKHSSRKPISFYSQASSNYCPKKIFYPNHTSQLTTSFSCTTKNNLLHDIKKFQSCHVIRSKRFKTPSNLIIEDHHENNQISRSNQQNIHIKTRKMTSIITQQENSVSTSSD